MACPTNQSALEERKNALKCEVESQNCTDPTNLKYHCVMNEYANHLVEVCAIATKIVGEERICEKSCFHMKMLYTSNVKI